LSSKTGLCVDEGKRSVCS